MTAKLSATVARLCVVLSIALGLWGVAAQPAAAATKPANATKSNQTAFNQLGLQNQVSRVQFLGNESGKQKCNPKATSGSTKCDPAWGLEDDLEADTDAAGFAGLLGIVTIAVWSLWASGMLSSGGGGTETVDALIRVGLAACGLALFKPLFFDGVNAINGLTHGILSAHWVGSLISNFNATVGKQIQVTVAGVAEVVGSGTLLHLFGGTSNGASLAGGLTIASLVSGTNPVAWIVQFIMNLIMIIGVLIIELERITLNATVNFAYVAGPLVIALGAFKGFQALTGAFWRIVLGVFALVLVWTLWYLMMAIGYTTSAQDLNAGSGWWSGQIVNAALACAFVLGFVFAPGKVARHIGGSGGGAGGIMRSVAMVGAFRAMRGGGRGGPAQNRRAQARARRQALGGALADTGRILNRPMGMIQDQQAARAATMDLVRQGAPPASGSLGGAAPGPNGGSPPANGNRGGAAPGPNGGPPPANGNRGGAAPGVNGSTPQTAGTQGGPAPAGNVGPRQAAGSGGPEPASNGGSPTGTGRPGGAAPASNGAAPSGTGWPGGGAAPASNGATPSGMGRPGGGAAPASSGGSPAGNGWPGGGPAPGRNGEQPAPPPRRQPQPPPTPNK